jgi:acetyl/propionyl-CoA carboxylase alpha subunit
MGLKDAAKRLMSLAGVPVTPGYLGDDQDAARLLAEAEAIGWPVLIKAVAGGGGKGMRRVERAEDFAAALAGAKRESAAAFGDDRVLLERYVTRPRHIEVQVFGDSHGNVVHLFERDCSLQRRHQKVIEEAPAPGLGRSDREALTAAAVRAARAVGYVGAGTVEFIADASRGLAADRIWFMEMNTRLQVEHPVTEAITGLDLVEWQLRVASGEALPLTQDQIVMRGHAMEARLYAEDPATGFLPQAGRLTHFRVPGAVRVDSGVEQGDEITAFYDPMIAKLIAHAPDRCEAARTLADACAAVEVWPVKTNAAFLAHCARHADFIAAEIDTDFIETRLADLLASPEIAPSSSAVAALAGPGRDPRSPWEASPGFRLNGAPAALARVYVDGAARDAPVAAGLSAESWLRDDDAVVYFAGGAAHRLSQFPPGDRLAAAGGGDGSVRAPMPGRIVQVAVSVGDRVVRGQTLIVLEAMKMEHALTAPFDGAVVELAASEGAQVSEGAPLARLASEA